MLEWRGASAGATLYQDDGGISRRTFVGWLVAGPTLIAAAELAPAAQAAIPSDQPSDHYDLTDLLTDSTRPTAHLITVAVNEDGTVSFALPRAEVGQGITTAVAMLIAEEMDVALDKVDISLADARPELVWNQLTGGSNTMHSVYVPVRTAAAIARGALLDAAAGFLDTPSITLSVDDGVITAPSGRTTTYGAMAKAASAKITTRRSARLKAQSQFSLVGTPQRRIEARAIVTGEKRFAMDLDVDGALPTMLARPPRINAPALRVNNLAQVKAMPGVTDVAVIGHTQLVPGGVAVRARAFGQCIDAVRALDVTWGASPVDGKSEASVLADLKKREVKLPPALPGGKTIDRTFTFHFRPGDPLETNTAIADVRADRAEIWSCLKSPVWVQEKTAAMLGLPVDKVTVHVTQGGGSFGRHLFADAAFEAAAVSKKFGKPVKLMWHRTDNFRQGRVHPMATSRVRATFGPKNVFAFDQRHTSVATDFTHGFGELITGVMAEPPKFNLGYSEVVFNLSMNVPYDFGAVSQALNEVYEVGTFNTSAVRNIYGPDVTTAKELMVDQLAKAMRRDPVAFRRAFSREPRLTAVLDAVAKAGSWGRAMPAGTAQGIALHKEYKGYSACLVEIDCRPETVNREIRDAYTGPRVTKVVFAVDVGLPINPLGLEAQMMGGIMDGIAQALTYSLHFKNGNFLEGSWDNAYYTRQWNTPPQVEVIVMPAADDKPGGAGEMGVPAAMAATACAYARATGNVPTKFPINHDEPLGFVPLPTVPPIPASPTDGLD